MKVIFFFESDFFYQFLQAHWGTKERIKQTRSHLGLNHFLLFSENTWQPGGSVDVSCGSALNFCSESCLQSSISQENAATKSCNFFLLRLILLLLGTQDLGWRRKFKLRVHFLWSQRLSLLLGAHLNPMPTALPSVPLLVAPENFILLANKT